MATLTVVAGVVTSPAHAAEGHILGAGSGAAIPGRYIVVLKDKGSGRAGEMAARARGLSDEYRGKLGAVYERTLSGFAVAMDEARARRLAGDPRVAYVEQDQVVRVADTQEYPEPNLDRIDQRTLPLDTTYTYDVYPSTAVTAYIIDSGIRITHTDFEGRASYGWDFVGNDPVADDCKGHGTEMAGVAGGKTYGVAKSVRLKAVRVFDCSGNSTTSSIQSGVEWVTANAVKPAVVNMSLGIDCVDGSGNPAPCPAGTGSAIQTAISYSIASGISYVIAAGNQNIDACGSPFNQVPGVISVGAVNGGDNKLFESNFGSCVDIWAPGHDITSTYIGNDSDIKADSGSSPAAAHVTGAVALMLTRPGFATKTPAELKAQLLAESTPNVLTGLGAGSPNTLLYTSPPPVAGGSPVGLAQHANGRLAMFGVNSSGTLFVRSQTQPNATTWSPWAASLDRNPNWYSVCSDSDSLNRIKLVGLRRNYEVWHRSQAAADANTWIAWQKFDGQLNSCAVATQGGKLQVFGTNAQGVLWRRSETSAGSGSFTPWTPVTGVPELRSVAAERNVAGNVQLFGISRTGEVWHCWAIETICTPGWSKLDGLLTRIAAARNGNGLLSIFGVNAAGQLFRRDNIGGVNTWLPWQQLDAPAGAGTLRSIAAETNADGRIELVLVDFAGQIWRRSQTTANSTTFGPWAQLDGLLRP